METVLDALPDQPLTAEDIATLNEAATVRLIPYTWYGEQVIAVLLLHDKRQKQRESATEDTSETDSETSDSKKHDDDQSQDEEQEADDAEQTSTGFGTNRSGTVGTVELLEDDSLAPEQDEETGPDETADDSGDIADDEADGTADDRSDEIAGGEDELAVYAVGYDDSAAGWVVIGQIDPDAELTEAEPLIREWISDRYHDQIVDKLAVGPSEYELGDSGE